MVNHTSLDHPWLQEARRDPKSKYRNWYVWSKQKPPNAKQGMVFPGAQKTTWTFDKIAGEYYYHRFYDHQPDLNTGNPEVRAEIAKIIDMAPTRCKWVPRRRTAVRDYYEGARKHGVRRLPGVPI